MIIQIVLLFLLPFIVMPQWRFPYEMPKVIVVQILIEVWALIVFFQHRHQLHLDWLSIGKRYWPYLGIFCLSVIHLLFFQTSTTLYGNAFRLQGVFLLWHLLAFSLLVSMQPMLKVPKLVIWLSLLGLLYTAWTGGQTLGGRSYGVLGEPNALAAVAIGIWPFVVLGTTIFNFQLRSKGYFKIFKHRMAKAVELILVILIVGVVVWLSGSRSGLLALSVQVGFLGLSSLKRIPEWLSGLVLGTIIVVGILLPINQAPGGVENRRDVWQTAWAAGFKQPLIGSGIGNIEQTLHQAGKDLDSSVWYQYVDSSHNIFLDWWVAFGVVGLSCFSWLVGQALVKFYKAGEWALFVALVGILVALLFNPASVVSLVMLWWLVGKSFDSLRSLRICEV